jgi:protein arginine N-methyltransferase 5
MIGSDTMQRLCVPCNTFSRPRPEIFQALKQELAYASYLNIQSAILPPPRNRAHVASYARAVNGCLKASPYMQLSIQLAPYDPSNFRPTVPEQDLNSAGAPKIVIPQLKAYDEELNAMWEMWDIIRSMCDYSTRLYLGEYL